MINRKDPCLVKNLCQNGATCVSRPNLNTEHFTCICRIGFTGQFCQTHHLEITNSNITRKDENGIDEHFDLNQRNSVQEKSKNRCLDKELNPCFDKVTSKLHKNTLNLRTNKKQPLNHSHLLFSRHFILVFLPRYREFRCHLRGVSGGL